MPIYLGSNIIDPFAKTFIGNGSVVNMNVYQTRNYSLGDNVGGGYVFYVEGTYPNQHGLIAYPQYAPTDWSWGCSGTSVTTGTAIYSGYQNTQNIIAACSTSTIGSRWCDGIIQGGFTTWYLPSIDELSTLYTNRTYVPGILSGSNTFHMSSTQGGNNTQYQSQNFNNGTITTIRDKNGIENNYIIPIRFF